MQEIKLNKSQIILSSSKESIKSVDYWEHLEDDINPSIQFNFENLYNINKIDICTKLFCESLKIKLIYTDAKFKIEEEIYHVNNDVNNKDNLFGIHIKKENLLRKLKLIFIEPNLNNGYKIKLYSEEFKIYDILSIYNDKFFYNLDTNTKEQIYNSFINYKFIENFISNDEKKSYQLIKRKVNVLNEPIQDGICILVCVMNRTNNIIHNITSWLIDDVNQIIILDWSTEKMFYSEIEKINDKRITYVYIKNEKKYIRSYAQNFGANLSKYNKILKLDADIIIKDKDFFKKHILKEGEFYVGDHFCARNDNEKSTHGLTYLFVDDYFRINGYNEYIKTYGWDDTDFTNRLLLSGIRKKLLDLNTVYHVPHDDILRVKNCIKINPHILTRTNRICCENSKLWNNNYELQKFKILENNNNLIICERENNYEYTFSSDLFNKSFNEATKLVFSWFKKNTKLHDDYFKNNDYDNMLNYLNQSL